LLHLHLYGIVANQEAYKYIGEAERLVNHQGLSALRFWLYSITIFIIAFSIKINIGLTGAMLIQSALNLLAIVFFYRALKFLFTSASLLPLLIVCIAIAFSPYSSWNVFLFTESIFYSSILLLLATLINYTYIKKTGNLLAIIFTLIVTILSRPLGILFIPAVLFYFYTTLSKKSKLVIVPIALIGAAILIYITNIVFTTTSDATITLSAKQGCVICGILPATNTKLNLIQDVSPLIQLGYYITHNFSQFILLATNRLQAFFLMTRPYFSTSHNYFLLAITIPLYGLSIVSFLLKKDKQYKPIFYFMLISIITFAIVVMLQCDDYHNRFILGLFPFFLIFAAKAFTYKKPA